MRFPAYLTPDQLDRLINQRLLRLEERYGTVRIELTHDLLTKAVLERRRQREVEEEKAALMRRGRGGAAGARRARARGAPAFSRGGGGGDRVPGFRGGGGVAMARRGAGK